MPPTPGRWSGWTRCVPAATPGRPGPAAGAARAWALAWGRARGTRRCGSSSWGPGCTATAARRSVRRPGRAGSSSDRSCRSRSGFGRPAPRVPWSSCDSPILCRALPGRRGDDLKVCHPVRDGAKVTGRNVQVSGSALGRTAAGPARGAGLEQALLGQPVVGDLLGVLLVHIDQLVELGQLLGGDLGRERVQGRGDLLGHGVLAPDGDDVLGRLERLFLLPQDPA